MAKNPNVNQSEYTSIIDSLRYAADCTRLDIAYAVGLLYSDANWNSLSDDSKATSGYIFNIAGGAVAWKSKKQIILAQLTMESEMIALAIASEEASWLRNLLSEIPTWEIPTPAILIHCDSTAAILQKFRIVTITVRDNRVPSCRSTLDRFTFVNVEVRVASYGILRAFTKLGYTCKTIKHGLF
ncbi:pentatricopeptide repeat-containing protein [Cucumis melo var. makuwa]|uniref:Pentatricopeptide repeat-containing protein n=1 Tax=Cucumis melo var. makuwa TaxID=1194695 RepID=A0A5A7UX49_CUCMM|nr:pentatricopeptide repeat-containing protein [Cucumis melo var. makuwa]